MIQFCKLCLIFAIYIIFWIPDASPYSWNFGHLINSGIIPYINILYIIPFILTFFFGIIFSREEFGMFFLGSFIASLVQGIISLFDSLSGYYHSIYDTGLYLSLLITIIFQVFIIMILYILGIFINKFFLNNWFKSLNDNDEPENNKELAVENNIII